MKEIHESESKASQALNEGIDHRQMQSKIPDSSSVIEDDDRSTERPMIGPPLKEIKRKAQKGQSKGNNKVKPIDDVSSSDLSIMNESAID